MYRLLKIATRGADEPPPRIVVAGNATVTTPPDRVQINFIVRGRGVTSDEAISAMAAKRAEIEAGLMRFVGSADSGAVRVTIGEVLAADGDHNDYGITRFSANSNVIGYSAEIMMTLRTAAVEDSGTIVGLIGRLGGTDPTIARFFLDDETGAQRRATVAAVADAQRQAAALAEGAGVQLGPVLSVANVGSSYDASTDIIVTANARFSTPPAVPALPPAIAVDLRPAPVETHAHVNIVYAIAR